LSANRPGSNTDPHRTAAGAVGVQAQQWADVPELLPTPAVASVPHALVTRAVETSEC
jgi:hypothetical protein